MQQSEQQNGGTQSGSRLGFMFGAVRAMHVIGTAPALLELRKRNEARLAIAKAKPAGQQVYRPE